MFSSRTNWRLEPNRFTQALENHRRKGDPLFDLTASNPTTCGFVYPEREIFAALADPRALLYAPESKGLLEARASVADYYRGHHGFASPSESAEPPELIDPDRIVLTSGTSEAYSYILRLLCDVGDEILVPAPSYPLFEFLAGLADVRLVLYQLLYDHGWQMDLAGLRAAITPRSRAVLVVHPNNPTGSFVKPDEAAELAAICAAHEMAIVADEVFLDYSTGSAAAASSPAPATFAFHRDSLTFTLGGLSKACALPQMKLAWLVVSGPPPLVRQAMDRLEVIADTYLSPSTPVQLAAPKFLALRHNMQHQLRQRIAANLAHLDAALAAPSGAPGTASRLTRLDREGGWYAVLRVPRTLPDDEVAVGLLERCSVLVHPGHFFDFAEDGFLVVSLITPEAEFQEGVRRLLNFFAD